MAASYDKVLIRHGHLKVYCFPSQLEQVSRQLLNTPMRRTEPVANQAADANALDDTGQQVYNLASTMHKLLAAHFSGKKVSSLKDGIYFLRHHVEMCGSSKKLVKKMNLLNDTFSTLRHFSPGWANELKSELREVLAGDGTNNGAGSPSDTRFGCASLNPSAPAFVPLAMQEDNCRAHTSEQNLIDVQNSTISALVGKLEAAEQTYAYVSAQFSKTCLKLDGITRLFCTTEKWEEVSEVKRWPRAVSRSANHAAAGNGKDNPGLAPKQASSSVRSTAVAELSKANETICELRSKLASNSAVLARKDELCAKGRVLRTTHVPGGSNDVNFSIGDLFLQYVGSADAALISEPYLVSGWQVDNLKVLLESMLSGTHIKRVQISTHSRSKVNEPTFDSLRQNYSDRGLTISVALVSDLHLREVSFSNGVVISADRGLDMYKAPGADGIRTCRASTVVCYEVDKGTVARTFNVAAVVAEEARSMLTSGISAEVLKIEGLVSAIDTKRKEDSQSRAIRLSMMERKVSAWLSDMGYYFKRGRFCGNRLTMTIKDFIQQAEELKLDLCTSEGLQETIKSFEQIDCLARNEVEDDEVVCDWRMYDEDGLRKDVLGHAEDLGCYSNDSGSVGLSSASSDDVGSNPTHRIQRDSVRLKIGQAIGSHGLACDIEDALAKQLHEKEYFNQARSIIFHLKSPGCAFRSKLLNGTIAPLQVPWMSAEAMASNSGSSADNLVSAAAKRVAIDGNSYTKEEFLQHYGGSQGIRCWEEAAPQLINEDK